MHLNIIIPCNKDLEKRQEERGEESGWGIRAERYPTEAIPGGVNPTSYLTKVRKIHSNTFVPVIIVIINILKNT